MGLDEAVAERVAIVVERCDHLRAPLPGLPEPEPADRAVASRDDRRVRELGLDLGPAVEVEATVAGGLGDGLALRSSPAGRPRSRSRDPTARAPTRGRTRAAARGARSGSRGRSQGFDDVLGDWLANAALEIGARVEPLAELLLVHDSALSAVALAQVGVAPLAGDRRAVSLEAPVVIDPVQVDQIEVGIRGRVGQVRLVVKAERPPRTAPSRAGAWSTSATDARTAAAKAAAVGSAGAPRRPPDSERR